MTARTARPGWQLAAGTVVVLLVLEEILTRTGVLPADYFPPVSQIGAALLPELAGAELWTQLGQTLQGWFVALLLATALAVPLGLLLGTVWWVRALTRPIVEFLRPVPSVALIPLVVLALGTGKQSELFLATFAAFWQLLVATAAGAGAVDRVTAETARCYGLTRAQTMRWVALPSALPYLVTGLRVASATSLILVVTTEILIGVPGLGAQISLTRAGGSPDLMYAYIIVTGLLGWLINIALTAGERRLLHWDAANRDTANRGAR